MNTPKFRDIAKSVIDTRAKALGRKVGHPDMGPLRIEAILAKWGVFGEFLPPPDPAPCLQCESTVES